MFGTHSFISVIKIESNKIYVALTSYNNVDIILATDPKAIFSIDI